MNATDPHMKKFFAHGGKLLMYHGWTDQNVSPYNTIKYFRSVQEALGAAKTDNSVRLFMAPGMGHCGGGEGPNTFDKIGALDRWVEEGKAPDEHHRVAQHRREGRPHAPAVPVPAGGAVQGLGQHRRRREFRLQAAVTDACARHR